MQELGSCMIIVASDAPVDALNLKRMGARAIMGMARTGAAGTNGSGDYVVAFSTQRNPEKLVPNDSMSPLFLATIEATEEAIINSLFAATKVGDVDRLPLDRTMEILRKYAVVK